MKKEDEKTIKMASEFEIVGFEGEGFKMLKN